MASRAAMEGAHVAVGAPAPSVEPVPVALRGVTKAFPGVVACDHVDLDIQPGEVLALLGENGAGKSTLMSILSGFVQADSGEIRVRDRPVRIGNAREAARHGIGMVYQHFMLVPPLTVAENVALGWEPRRLFLNRREIARRVREVAEASGLALPPDRRVSELSVGMQQRVEIVKALYHEASVLILDEPTAVLTPQETSELFTTIRRMKAQGRSIVFISHKLKEVLAIADRIVVMRSGAVVGATRPEETDESELAGLVVGRAVAAVRRKPGAAGEAAPAASGRAPAALVVENVTTPGEPGLQGVSFEVRHGEILGIAGVDGNGQVELEEVLTGLRPASGGSVLLDGRPLPTGSPRDVIAAGVAHVPSDRGRWGLVGQATVSENLSLADHRSAPFSTRGLLRPAAIREHARRLVDDFDIRVTGVDQNAGTLSGGNQQKLVVAREMTRDGLVAVVAAQPTRGLDVGAAAFMHRQLLQLRDRGVGVILISAELDEVMALSDRIGVLYDGRLAGLRDADTATREELGMLMGGAGSTPSEAASASGAGT